MNSRQMQYAVLLSELRNFSQVAEKLDISQPALSKQIISLERELGVRLFDRNSVPLTLTPAGEHFVQRAEELLFKEAQLLRSMDSYKSGEKGKLVIGISPFRSLYLMPGIIREFKKKYPGIEVVLHETGSDQLRKDAVDGKYDFAIVNLPVDEALLDVAPIEPDTLVLAVPKKMAQGIPALKADPQLQEIDIADCRGVPFIAVGHNQELRKLFDKLCASAGFHPEIAVEVVGVATAWAMAHAGIGATLLPLQFIEGEGFDDTISLFRIKNRTHLRQPVIVVRRGQYLTEYAKYAMKLLKGD